MDGKDLSGWCVGVQGDVALRVAQMQFRVARSSGLDSGRHRRCR